MKKYYLLIVVFISSFVLSQDWQYNPESNPYNNPYNNPNRKPYDDLARKKEKEINRDMGNIRKIINQSGSIYDQIKKNEEERTQNNASGPGAPGEPVPIDNYKTTLLVLGILILLFYLKKIIDIKRL